MSEAVEVVETDDTDLENRCTVLGALWLFYRDTDNETWSDFFAWADLGLPLAYFHWQELAYLRPDAIDLVNETWNVFCEMIEIDPDGEYEDLKAAFAASPNPPVQDDDESV